MAKIAGRITIRMDGAVLATENRGTLDLGGFARTPETHGGLTHYSEEEQPPMLEVSILINKDTDIMKLNEMTDGTVFVEADTGQEFVMRKAFTVDPVVFDASGKSSMKISCEQVEQV